MTCLMFLMSFNEFNKYGSSTNKANLRDLIAASRLVILLNLDLNNRFFKPCDLEIWWMTSKNNREPLLYYIKLSASFQIQTAVTVWKQFGSKSAIFCPMWPWNLIDDLEKQQGTSPMPHWALCIISKPSVNSSLSYSPETLNLGQNWQFFCPVWPLNLKDDFEKPLLYCLKLCASYHSHHWILNEVKVQTCKIWVKISDSFVSRQL